jgi:hypothetical protein
MRIRRGRNQAAGSEEGINPARQCTRHREVDHCGEGDEDEAEGEAKTGSSVKALAPLFAFVAAAAVSVVVVVALMVVMAAVVVAMVIATRRGISDWWGCGSGCMGGEADEGAKGE